MILKTEAVTPKVIPIVKAYQRSYKTTKLTFHWHKSNRQEHKSDSSMNLMQLERKTQIYDIGSLTLGFVAHFESKEELP